MSKVIKFFLILWVLIAIGGLISHFAKFSSGIPPVAWGLVIVGLIVTTPIIRERIRRKKEGYYVSTYGGAEYGYVLYNEGGKTIRLYFSRIKDTVYVPSDAKWREIMPVWARDRKDEIMSRIRKHVGKRLIGKGWTYEESDKLETLVSQD
jgi:hypothetical protein